MNTHLDISKYIELRHEIHKHPELKYEETNTAQLVAKILKDLGYVVSEGLGKTGVVGLLDTQRPGPCIAFRSDMDALPIHEQNCIPYKSTIDGKMHACGHDGHTASLLCAAEALMQRKDQYKGKIKLIFQPAEEGGAGAKAMIDDGVLESPKVDMIFGFHNRPGFEQGYIFAKPGSAMGGDTSIEIIITGKGGHAAMPHLACDPIVVAAQFINHVQAAVARQLSPLRSGVVTVSSIQAGSRKGINVIPDACTLTISLRSDSLNTRNLLVAATENALKSACISGACDYAFNVLLDIPALVNDPKATDIAINAFKKNFDHGKVEKIDYMPTMGAEDFSFYLEEVCGCYFFIGNGLDSAYLHNPHYDFNDSIISVAKDCYLSLADSLLS
ncbi:M20 family metallopeptidase [Pseudomonas sp. M30-35]|uniref:M20 metallopeptidase family protein n=1 Tax=Pseudomonas sp. M30-35 TaxID=1981174 RepID=UPI000B3C2223|nr:M20 family metallopeptidase [Pseudomonas sp. M30-35]ARU87984.1 amidohydrolase [Pseudomonas sp. M30-35]